MKVSLKSVMELAHSFKRQYLLSMAGALKMAWAKAKGFSNVAEISVVNVDKTCSRVYLFGHSSDEVRAARIAFVNEIARERVALSWNNVRGVLGSAELTLTVYAPLPNRKLMSTKDYFANVA